MFIYVAMNALFMFIYVAMNALFMFIYVAMNALFCALYGNATQSMLCFIFIELTVFILFRKFYIENYFKSNTNKNPLAIFNFVMGEQDQEFRNLWFL